MGILLASMRRVKGSVLVSCLLLLENTVVALAYHQQYEVQGSQPASPTTATILGSNAWIHVDEVAFGLLQMFISNHLEVAVF